MTAMRPGATIFLMAAAVEMATQWVYWALSSAAWMILHLLGRLALLVFGLLRPPQGGTQLGDLAELPPHLLDHVLRGLAHGDHGHGREAEGQHAADQQADEHVGVGGV